MGQGSVKVGFITVRRPFFVAQGSLFSPAARKCTKGSQRYEANAALQVLLPDFDVTVTVSDGIGKQV